MRRETKESYVRRIDRVIGHLNQQVKAGHTLCDLAGIAGISPFHFHRIYRAVTGETPAGTLRRLRLARGAALLKDGGKPITEIAFDVGYESSQAFAKAFRQMTGYSASGLRQQPQALDDVITELSSPPAQPVPQALEVRLVSVEPFKVIAARHVGPHEGLFSAYTELMDWVQKTGQADDFRGIYGIPIDDVRGVPQECRFDCCFDLGTGARPGEDHHEVMLGGGHYAVTRHVGPYAGLEEKYDFLYGSWLEATGYPLREAPFYNHYVTDPETRPPEEWETDIYLPVENS